MTGSEKNKLKVLIFMTQFYRLGGAEKLAVELAVELNKRGIHADIVSLYRENLPGVKSAKEELQLLGITNVYFLGLKIHPTIFSVVKGIFKLRKLLRKEQVHVIETSAVLPTIMAYWATIWNDTLHVAGIHMAYDKIRDRGLLYKAWRLNCRFFSRTRYYAISDYVANAWLNFSEYKKANIRTIYNAIPNNFFNTKSDKINLCKELNLNIEDKIAIFVGRLSYLKGVDTLLDALGPILKERRLSLLLVGVPDFYLPGTDKLIGKLKLNIEKEKWGTLVRFLGFRRDIPRLMASSDILVHPTRNEGFGLAIVEAMAVGIQVVTSNVEGIPEVVKGTNTVMVSPSNPNELQRAVIECITRSDEEINLAIKKGKERSEEFRIDKRVNNFISLFNEYKHK